MYVVFVMVGPVLVMIFLNSIVISVITKMRAKQMKVSSFFDSPSLITFEANRSRQKDTFDLQLLSNHPTTCIGYNNPKLLTNK